MRLNGITSRRSRIIWWVHWVNSVTGMHDISKTAPTYRLAFHLQGTSVLIRKSPGDNGMYKVRSYATITPDLGVAGRACRKRGK